MVYINNTADYEQNSTSDMREDVCVHLRKNVRRGVGPRPSRLASVSSKVRRLPVHFRRTQETSRMVRFKPQIT